MSPLFRRRASAPPPIPGLDLEPKEKVLAAGETSSGPLVATTHRLVVPTGEGPRSLAWPDVERASWDSDAEELLVVETAPVGSRPRRHRLQVGEARTVLHVLREQVNASVVVSRHIALVGPKGVRVSGRRRPGEQSLMWKVAVDTGVDADDPAIRADIDRAIAQVRAEVE
jgi:hypothetical protein